MNMRSCRTFIVVIVLLAGSLTMLAANQAKSDDLIDEYTWCVLRYDHKVASEQFGPIAVANPTAGIVLIPANMMSLEVCRAAVTSQGSTIREILDAYEKYCIDNMLHTGPAFLKQGDEWNTPNIASYRKESADEMEALGQICFRGDLIGDCYAQASFNTAALRLAGVPPEEVFTITIWGHAINIIKVDGEWNILDSTYADYARKGYLDSLLFEEYPLPPPYNRIMYLENDKYFINFGTPAPQYYPNLVQPYCNIDDQLLIEMMEAIVPKFNNSYLGGRDWEIHRFLENATPCPEMKTLAVPISVKDAAGSTIEEKAQSLAALVEEFVLSQKGDDPPTQYDRCLYCKGDLSVDYPQAYANAAKYAAWTSYLAIRLDRSLSILDPRITVLWIRLNILNRQILSEDCVAFSDFPYLRRAGSSVDQAVMAYGTLRNMKNDGDFWPVDDLYVLVTDDYRGYLAVNVQDTWQYLSFDQGKMMSTTAPDSIQMVFNEIEYLETWEG
jgi:hypothetical protein